MRTIIELPQPDLDALDTLCRREGISRAEAIRRAVSAHLAANRAGEREAVFGLWRPRRVDGVSYQRKLRKEWDAGR